MSVQASLSLALSTALGLAMMGCGIRGPPKPAPAGPTTPYSLQQDSPGREFPSRSPFQESGTPPSLQEPTPLPPLPDGGLQPFSY